MSAALDSQEMLIVAKTLRTVWIFGLFLLAGSHLLHAVSDLIELDHLAHHAAEQTDSHDDGDNHTLGEHSHTGLAVIASHSIQFCNTTSRLSFQLVQRWKTGFAESIDYPPEFV